MGEGLVELGEEVPVAVAFDDLIEPGSTRTGTVYVEIVEPRARFTLLCRPTSGRSGTVTLLSAG